MPTTREVAAKRQERIRRSQMAMALDRQARHFGPKHPDRTGPPCPVCGEATSRYVVHRTGDRRHPCCAGL